VRRVQFRDDPALSLPASLLATIVVLAAFIVLAVLQDDGS
jgi:hypothetical protein